MAQERDGLLRLLYVTIFLISTSFGAATFLLPVYAAELGASYVALGSMGAIGAGIYMVMTLVSGFLLDMFDRGRLYLVFSVAGAGVVLLFSAATSVRDLMMLRGLLGVVSAMFFPTANTLVADLSPLEVLTRSIGRYNLSWIAGFIAGPFLGGLISEHFGFPILFVIMAILIAVSCPVIWKGLVVKARAGNVSVRQGFDASALKGLWATYLMILPYGAALGVYMSILPGQMRALGIVPSVIGLMLTMTNGMRGVGFFNVERFVDWGERRSLRLASCLMCAALLILAFSRTIPSFIIPLVMFGLSGGILTPLIQNTIARSSPRHVLGMAMALNESMYGATMFIGPLVGGILAEVFQPTTLYLSLAGLSLAILPLSFMSGVAESS